MNLAVNASDAMPEGGSLEIATRQMHIDAAEAERTGLGAGAWVELTVRDSGPGIPAADLNRIFEPYQQAHEGRNGSGLGLAIVKGLVEAHGGSISVDSEEGKGTCFVVRLPKAAQGV